ncbi:hypothetical protein ACTFIW_011168 [Dictyostelium discoideum]
MFLNTLKVFQATSTTFYSAFLFFNVLEHMGVVSQEVKLKKKYASWRSVDINTAIKNGVTPSPPPSIDQNEEGGASGETEEDAQLKQLEMELNLAKETLQQDNEALIKYQQHKQSPPQQQQQQQHHNIHDNEALIKYQQQVAQQNLTIQKQKYQNQMLQDEVEQKQQQIQLQQQQLQQQQQQIQQLQKQIQQQQKQLMSGGGSGGSNMPMNLNHTPSDTDKASAEKYSKWVISSLQFDDVPSAVKNAKLSLKYLTGEDS